MNGLPRLRVGSHEAFEIGAPQHEQVTVSERDDVGLPRSAGEQRHFPEELTVSQADAAFGENHFDRSGGDKKDSGSAASLAHDSIAGKGKARPQQPAHTV